LNAKDIGQLGERYAQSYLIDKGYTVVDTNWHCKHGEIDIIVKDANEIIFVEVKTRQQAFNADISTPLENITPQKMKKWLASVYEYIEQYQLIDPICRFDAIAVTLYPDNTYKIYCVEDALDW